MNWYWLLVSGLATNQAVEIWHHSVLFDDYNAANNRWLETVDDPPLWKLRPRQLLACAWCLSVWVCLCIFGWTLWCEDSHWMWNLVPQALAGSRLANLINDLTYPWLRTPRIDHQTIAADIEHTGV